MNVIISTDFTVEFLEDYNKYKVKIFRVQSTFNGLSNDISLIVVARNLYSLYMFKVCRQN